MNSYQRRVFDHLVEDGPSRHERWEILARIITDIVPGYGCRFFDGVVDYDSDSDKSALSKEWAQAWLDKFVEEGVLCDDGLRRSASLLDLVLKPKHETVRILLELEIEGRWTGPTSASDVCQLLKGRPLASSDTSIIRASFWDHTTDVSCLIPKVPRGEGL